MVDTTIIFLPGTLFLAGREQDFNLNQNQSPGSARRLWWLEFGSAPWGNMKSKYPRPCQRKFKIALDFLVCTLIFAFDSFSSVTPMVRFIFLVFIGCWLGAMPQSLAQKKKKSEADKSQKVTVLARIQIHASLAKGTPIAEVFKMPPFFGAKSEEISYRFQAATDQFPPTTGDSIRELTSDSLVFFLKQDLTEMSGYGDKGGNSKDKRNYIHNLPTENPQKMAVDTNIDVDEAIDIACHWTFVPNEKKDRYTPTIEMKMDVYDNSGQARSEKSVLLKAADIRTSHFKKAYGIEYDFVKGVPLKEIEDGGIVGNVVTDVYLQALTRLLKTN